MKYAGVSLTAFICISVIANINIIVLKILKKTEKD